MGFDAYVSSCWRGYEVTMSSEVNVARTSAAGCSNDGYVVMAGPGTSITMPGIIVSEIANALAALSPARRIEVDLGTHPTMGIHRAPSLSAAHDVAPRLTPKRFESPRSPRARKREFRHWIGQEAKLAVAYAWPGIGNRWIRDFLRVAKAAGVPTVVLCASLPSSREVRAISLADTIRGADRVVVGDAGEASELETTFGSFGPQVSTHRALSLVRRDRRPGPQQFTSFLPSEGGEALSALIAAFDSIPEARIENYKLKVITRYEENAAEAIVAKSFHARHVQLLSDEMTAEEVRQLVDTSSALSIGDPNADSRAFSAAVDCGIVTVVLAKSKSPLVGRGYVGGLLADGRRPASIRVAMAHALRLDELGFPRPDAWRDLAECLVETQQVRAVS
jgi:hypothetical protein